MLPFLKNRNDASATGEDEPTKMKTKDDDDQFSMLKAVAADMMDAFKKGNVRSLEEALGALCEHIKEEDEEQDSLMTPGA
jgi:hypothetical protein